MCNKVIPSRTDKEYYKDNTDKIIHKQKETFICACGSCTQKCVKARHEQSRKHLDYIKTN